MQKAIITKTVSTDPAPVKYHASFPVGIFVSLPVLESPKHAVYDFVNRQLEPLGLERHKPGLPLPTALVTVKNETESFLLRVVFKLCCCWG